MGTGSITEYVDVAQVALYVFWAFFAGLILYLRREDKREGYPLETERSDGRVVVRGFPGVPTPKVFSLPHGGTYEAPGDRPQPPPASAEPTAPWPGAPLEPVGDPMLSGLGPAAYAVRSDEPELTFHGEARIVPMRVATSFSVEPRDPDPRGMEVVGSDGVKAGTVCDIWVDRSEPQVRYLEVDLAGGEPGRRALLPVMVADIDAGRERVRVRSILGRHFAKVPSLSNPDRVSQTEEDRICAFYAGGQLYSEPARREPLL